MEAEIKEILKRPHRRVLVPDADVGGFSAIIAEFPGCIAEGDTPEEAYETLERTAESWLEGMMEQGLPIPDPTPEDEEEYSGRVVLRMPRSTHRRAAGAGRREGVC